MKPFLSVVIPYYNNPEALARLLESLAKSKNAPTFEVIVVDDGSNIKYQTFVPSSGRGISNIKYGKLKKVLRVIRLSRNRGPAVARNRGVAKAKGEFVVFLDSDVEVFPDTLLAIAKVFREDPDVVALTGVWVKEQRSRAFFPNFKALRDWSYWINERDKSGYYFLFSTRIAAIKRSVFLRLGGFDESYPAPLVEDIELTYRIARRYAIIFAPQVRVRHEFEGFFPIAKKYFRRAYYWTKLYQRRKKFDPVATTWQEAITTVSGVGAVGGGAALLLAYLSNLSYLRYLGELWLVVAGLHLFLVRKFLAFVWREKSLWFAVQSFFVGLILYCIIFAGALAGRLGIGQRR